MNDTVNCSFLSRTENDVFKVQRTKRCIKENSYLRTKTTFTRLALIFVLMPLLFSCASLNVMKMVPDKAVYGEQKPVTISLEMDRTGNKGTSLYSGTITQKEFKTAILKSLEKARLFKGIEKINAADYLIKVRLVYAGSHPGFNMTAWVNAQWSVINQGTKTVVWSKLIKGKGRATVGEAFNGAKRQYMALERGAKANIEQALNEISALELSETN